MEKKENPVKILKSYIDKQKKYNISKGRKEPTGKINRSDIGLKEDERQR